MLKAYKYRLYPTEEQSVLMDKHFGCVRFIYNWGLNEKIKAYEQAKLKLSCFELIVKATELKKEFPWLAEVYSQSIQMSLRNLDNAFTAFFRKNRDFPKFKSKHKSRLSCQFSQCVKIDFENNEIFIPKIKKVKAVIHRGFKGKIKTCTLSKTSTHKYFISILVENGEQYPVKQKVSDDTTLGIDVGLKHFVVFSNGKKIKNPKYLRKSEKKLKILQYRLSKKQIGSKNRQDLKYKVALQHEKITNQRKDFLHKLTHNTVCENQATMYICEDLNVKGMVKNHCLAKSISDASWSTFISFLQYKCEWYGKTFQQIGRFDPSSKICNVCGYIYKDLTLNIRKWRCPECLTQHDRDINAAINIKKFGIIRSQGAETELKQSLLERLDVGLER